MSKFQTLCNDMFAALTAAMLMITTSAYAQSPAEKWVACRFEAGGGVGTNIALIVFEPFPVAGGLDSFPSIDGIFEEKVGVGTVVPGYKAQWFLGGLNDCQIFSTQAEARSRYERNLNIDEYAIIKSIAWAPPEDFGRPSKPTPKANPSGVDGTGSQGTVAKDAAPLPEPALPKKTAEEVEREKRRAEEQADAAAQQKIYDEQKARQKAFADVQRDKELKYQEAQRAHAQRVAEAAAAKAEWEKVVAESRARDAAYQRQIAEHARQTACASGKKSACSASTDTDANRCVTTPSLKMDASFKGNTAASVINGCAVPVDIRICLRRPEGWNCGVGWGIPPQGSFSHSSFEATGAILSDARNSSSSKPLAQP